MPYHLYVVAAVIRDDGRILACRRRAGTSQAGAWEFPGGKVEPGEAPEAALAREIVEELGVAIAVGALLDRTATPVGDLVIDLACYEATLSGPRPSASTDHDRLAWVEPPALASLAWATPDLPAVRKLVADSGRGPAPPPRHA